MKCCASGRSAPPPVGYRDDQDDHRLKETLTGKVDYRRRKIELRIEPRFNSVLIGRSYIREMVRHERANMARFKLRLKELFGTRLPQPRQQAGSVSYDPAGWLLASRTQVEDCLPTGLDDDSYSDIDVRR